MFLASAPLISAASDLSAAPPRRSRAKAAPKARPTALAAEEAALTRRLDQAFGTIKHRGFHPSLASLKLATDQRSPLISAMTNEFSLRRIQVVETLLENLVGGARLSPHATELVMLQSAERAASARIALLRGALAEADGYAVAAAGAARRQRPPRKAIDATTVPAEPLKRKRSDLEPQSASSAGEHTRPAAASGGWVPGVGASAPSRSAAAGARPARAAAQAAGVAIAALNCAADFGEEPDESDA